MEPFKQVMRYSLLIILSILLFGGCSRTTPKKYHEKHYQVILCDELNGKIEVVLEDRTRVDCLTDEYAIEVDFAKKWAEGIGQSLYYGYMTDKKPAVALIVGEKDARYLKRLKKVANELDIKIYKIEKE